MYFQNFYFVVDKSKTEEKVDDFEMRQRAVAFRPVNCKKG